MTTFPLTLMCQGKKSGNIVFIRDVIPPPRSWNCIVIPLERCFPPPVPGQDVDKTVSIGFAQCKPQKKMMAIVHQVGQII